MTRPALFLAPLFRLAGFVGLVCVALGCAGCGPKSESKTSLATSESWCPDGFEIGPRDTCFAIPEKHDKDTPILVYLHGNYEGHGSAEEWALVHGATTKGFAVIIPRGKHDLCPLREELKNSFCWPAEAEDPQAAKAVADEWERVLWQVDALLETGTHRRYVLGLGEGGAFASYLASRSLFHAHGWAVVNGHPLEPMQKASKVGAFVLVNGTADAPKTKELHEGLTRAGVPHAHCTRSGGHALAAEDVEASLAYFRHDAKAEKSEGKGPFACEGGTKTGP